MRPAAACQLLFNVPAPVATRLLPKLEPRDVRIAGNKMGARRHSSPCPPRMTPASPAETRVRDARRSLLRYICRRRHTAERSCELPWGHQTYHTGPVDPRLLRFGRYLYCRGAISSEMLDDALEWQRRKRPRMGQIAMREDIMSPREFALLMCFSAQGEMFGEAARERGFLDGAGLRRIKNIQDSYDHPIGQYFIEKGVLKEPQVEAYHHDMMRHNLRFAA